MPLLLRVREARLADAVRAVQLGVRKRRRHVLVDLDRAVGGDAREQEAVHAGGLQAVGVGAVVRRVLLDARVASLEVRRLGVEDDDAGEACAVGLLVVGDRDRRAAVVLELLDERGGLDLVARHDARVVALAGRVVLVRLARLGARLARGEARVRVRRRDHAETGLVEDRDRDRRGARVELTDVGDGGLVLRGLAGVRRDLRGIPVAGLRGRVVERRVLDRGVAGLVVGLVERERDALLQRPGLCLRGALERQGRVDVDGAAAATAGAAVVRTARGYDRRESAAMRQPAAALERNDKVIPPQRCFLRAILHTGSAPRERERQRLPQTARRRFSQHRHPGLRQDGFRMELHALRGQLAVADRHHDAAPGGADLEAVRQRVVDDQRVVAADGQRRGQALEDACGRRARSSSSCRGRARAGRRSRRTPAPAPGGRGRRRAAGSRPPGSGAPPRARCPPRSACTGRARRPRGRARAASSSSTVAASLRTTSSSAPSSPSSWTRL